MLSPLSAVQSNTRVTRSRAKTGTTPAPSAASKFDVHSSPIKASPALDGPVPPPTPMTPAMYMPAAPPPTPVSPMVFQQASPDALAKSLGSALASALAAVPEPAPLCSAPAANLGSDLAQAMEDLVVDPTSEAPALAIAAPTLAALEQLHESAPAMEETHDDDAGDDDVSSVGNASESTDADDGMGVTSRMRLYGMLPPGVLSKAPHDGPSHIRFEQPESALPRADTSRVYGMFPPGALTANATSSSHIRFGDDDEGM